MSQKQWINVGKYALGLLLGGGLLYLAFEGVSYEKLRQYIGQIHYGWLVLSLVIGGLSHFIRAARWGMQLRASGYQTSLDRLYSAVMIGYLVNLGLPRAGELARCTVLYRSDQIPVPKSLGTVAVERVFDVIILGLMILLTVSLEYDTLMGYFDLRASSGSEGNSWLLPALAGTVVIGALGAFLLRKQLLRVPLFQRIWNFVKELFEAAFSIRHIQKPWLFVVYTVLIWVCYILMTYVALFALPDIAHLETNHFYISIIITAMGGIGMAMPVPGGVGAYHKVVTFTFESMKIGGNAAKDLGIAFATILHAAQNIGLIVLLGGIGYFYLNSRPARNAAISPDSVESA